MTRTSLILTFAAVAALAGCNKENHTIVAGPDTGDNTVVAKTPAALPPSVVSSKTYRCADNKIVYVDWLSDNKSANVRTEKEGSLTQVTAAQPGKAMTAAGGYSVEGTSSASTVKIAVPGHASQTCNG
ncbi:MAG TPA: hypothetical protein VGU01_02075 [Sphingomicrobium sp.]|nr:hypothetical protein [Sphingomicrobium sp.]